MDQSVHRDRSSRARGLHGSKRFCPSALTEKLVPVALMILTLVLVAVLVLLGLSLMGPTT
jgi:hypothetical protein